MKCVGKMTIVRETENLMVSRPLPFMHSHEQTDAQKRFVPPIVACYAILQNNAHCTWIVG
jgi:hypothetical protein